MVFPITCGALQHPYNSSRSKDGLENWRFVSYPIVGLSDVQERKS